jgi:hypothetical protein
MANIKNGDKFVITSEKELEMVAERIFQELEEDSSFKPEIFSERENKKNSQNNESRKKNEKEYKEIFFDQNSRNIDIKNIKEV